jgi:hypothetical protein
MYLCVLVFLWLNFIGKTPTLGQGTQRAGMQECLQQKILVGLETTQLNKLLTPYTSVPIVKLDHGWARTSERVWEASLEFILWLPA